MEPGAVADRVGKPPAWKIWTARLLRWALAVVFIWAGSLKILHAERFAEAVYYYHLLPMDLVNWVAIFMPWLEVVCGVALLTGVCARGAAALVIPMMIVFMAALGYSIYRGLDINCGCFGLSESGKRVGYLEIGRNLLLLAAAVGVLILEKPVQTQPKS